jgi:hypothetical protein
MVLELFITVPVLEFYETVFLYLFTGVPLFEARDINWRYDSSSMDSALVFSLTLKIFSRLECFTDSDCVIW